MLDGIVFPVYLFVDRWISGLSCASPHLAVLRYSHHMLLWERSLRNPALGKLDNPYFLQCIWPELSCAIAASKSRQDYYFWCWKPLQQTSLIPSASIFPSPWLDLAGYRHNWTNLMHDLLRQWPPWLWGNLLPVHFHSLRCWRRGHGTLIL